jgi:hypothetical protein
MPEIVKREERDKANNRGEIQHFRRGVELAFWRPSALVIHHEWWFSAKTGIFAERRG